MTDRTTRSAAWLAALVAVPIALIAGAVVFFSLHGRVVANAAAKPTPSASPTIDAAPVAMSAPTLTPADAQMCLAFIAALPVEIDNLTERHVTAGPEQNAAFGDPPITVSCGGPAPKVGATDEVFNASGVCWYAQSGPNGTVLTTIDRQTPVAVTVPNSYGDGQLQWANEFWKPIESALPSIPTPYNC